MVDFVEEEFAAHGGHAEGIAVVADALDHALEQVAGLGVGRVAEAQRVQRGDGASAHGEDVAVDAADAGGGALVGLDGRRVVVALDFEADREAIAEVHEAGVFFTRGSEHFHAGAVAGLGQLLEPENGVFVGAVLAPHNGVDAQLGEVRHAAEQLHDSVELLTREAELFGGVGGGGL